MTTLNQRIADLAVAIGTDIKGLRNTIGVLTSLNTTDKTSIVNAINELVGVDSEIHTLIGGTGTQIAAAVGLSGSKSIKEALIEVALLISTETTNRTTADSGLDTRLTSVETALLTAGAQINDSAPSTTEVYSSQKVEDLVLNLENTILGGIPLSTLDTIKELADFLTDNTVASGLVSQLAKRVRVDAAQSFTSGEKSQARTNIDAASGTDFNNLVSDLGTLDYNYVSDYTTAKT
jgi:hypothetical protein